MMPLFGRIYLAGGSLIILFAILRGLLVPPQLGYGDRGVPGTIEGMVEYIYCTNTALFVQQSSLSVLSKKNTLYNDVMSSLL